MELWTLDEICEFAKYSRKVGQKMIAQPDFPKAIRWTDGAHPRWVAEEVQEWMMARRAA